MPWKDSSSEHTRYEASYVLFEFGEFSRPFRVSHNLIKVATDTKHFYACNGSSMGAHECEVIIPISLYGCASWSV